MAKTRQLLALALLAAFFTSLLGCSNGASGGTVKIDKEQMKAVRQKKEEKG